MCFSELSFFGVPVCKCSLSMIDAHLWSVACVLFYPASIIFLLILFAALFGLQVYNNVCMVKYIYLLFSRFFWFPISVWKVSVNLRIRVHNRKAPEPLGERYLHLDPQTGGWIMKQRSNALSSGRISSDNGVWIWFRQMDCPVRTDQRVTTLPLDLAPQSHSSFSGRGEI